MNSKQVPDTKPTPSTAREWGNKTHDEVYVAIWKTLEPFNAKVSDVSKLTKKILAIFDAHVSSIAPVAAEKAAIKSSIEFLEKRLANRRCDSDGVACCERCNTIYLARVMRETVSTIESAGRGK